MNLLLNFNTELLNYKRVKFKTEIGNIGNKGSGMSSPLIRVVWFGVNFLERGEGDIAMLFSSKGEGVRSLSVHNSKQ